MSNKYRLLINGTNFLLNLEKEAKYGFYTQRYVKASSEEEATQKSLDLIREELWSQVRNARSDPPRMYIEEIVELESFGDQRGSGKGFTFYPEDENQNSI